MLIFVKVWWRYVLPNANAANFCYILFRHSVGNLPRKTVSKIKNSAPLGSTRIIFHGLFTQLSFSVIKSDRLTLGFDSLRRTNLRRSLPSSKHSILVWNVFIYGLFWSRTIFYENRKKLSTYVNYKSKQKLHVVNLCNL